MTFVPELAGDPIQGGRVSITSYDWTSEYSRIVGNLDSKKRADPVGIRLECIWPRSGHEGRGLRSIKLSQQPTERRVGWANSPGEPLLTFFVHDDIGCHVAVLTIGAYTVALKGPSRRFDEPTASDPVEHDVWVRTLPSPFHLATSRLWLHGWLEQALLANAARIPDVLAIATQYLHGAPGLHEGDLKIAGAASYGPLVEGRRQEGSDFNDYLGLEWEYGSGQSDKPEASQFGCLDCSGYMRMIWGFRHNLEGSSFQDRIPLSRTVRADRSALPRRAYQMFERGPGVVVTRRRDGLAADLSRLQVGDLVFFDADPLDGSQVDHVGMYLGLDRGGHARFISSRKRHNGPTFGDEGGRSILDGSGLYATAFAGSRRL
jgi:cell wall-associated NlpC family hydrolase